MVSPFEVAGALSVGAGVDAVAAETAGAAVSGAETGAGSLAGVLDMMLSFLCSYCFLCGQSGESPPDVVGYLCVPVLEPGLLSAIEFCG